MSRYRDVHVIKAASMSSPRVNAASVYFNGSLWVTGGQSNAGILDTTEWYIFAQDKWIQGPTLPMKLVKHSMAVVGNSSVVLITGGLQAVSDNYLNDPSMKSQDSKRTWIYDTSMDTFEETGNFNMKRIEHSCASIPNTDTVGCIGGYSDDFGKNPDLRKMEIFDMNEKVWKISKHFLPVIDDFVLWGASMVALSNTLILAGGATPKNGPMNLIFEYHKDFGFRLLEDKLQLRRVDHVLLCLTSDELSNVDSLELKIAELPEILLTGGKNNLATYILKQNETKLLENSNSQQLSGATMFKIQGESESEEIPGFCGGKISHLKISSKCFQWLNETWVEMESLKSPRYSSVG